MRQAGEMREMAERQHGEGSGEMRKTAQWETAQKMARSMEREGAARAAREQHSREEAQETA